MAAVLTEDRIRRGHRRAALLMGSPALIGLLLFLIVPFVMALGLTFTDQRLLSPYETEFVGLKNYDRLLAMTVLTQKATDKVDGRVVFERVRAITRSEERYAGFRPLTSLTLGTWRVTLLAKDPVFIRSLVNTLAFALIVVPLQCALALGMALLIDQKIRGRTAFRTMFFAPVVVSMVVVSILWVMLYNKDVGLVNKALAVLSFGLAGEVDWLGNPLTALGAIAVMSAWQGAGFQMVIFLAGLQGIDATLYEAAEIDGANGWEKFRYVTLPGLANTITFVVIATAIGAFGLFTQVDVMTQGGPANATSTVMHHAITKGVREQDIAYGSAISVIYFLVITLMALGRRRLLEPKGAQ